VTEGRDYKVARKLDSIEDGNDRGRIVKRLILELFCQCCVDLSPHYQAKHKREEPKGSSSIGKNLQESSVFGPNFF